MSSPIKREVTIGNCRLLLGDMREIVPTLSGIEACLADPPYGLGKRMQGGTWGAKDEFSGFLQWDLEARQEWVDLMLSLDVPTIIWGANYFNVPPARCWLLWSKVNAVPTMADAELAWTNLDRPAKRFDAPVGRVEFGHPTSKPLPLIQWCLSFLDGEGPVLDPFFGSGTTAVGCIKAGRPFVGVEINETYFNAACRRIQDAVDRPDLFITPRAPEPVQQPLFGGEAA